MALRTYAKASFFVCILAACSSTRTSASGNVVDGSVDGVSLPVVKEAMVVYGSMNGSAFMLIGLSDATGNCAHAQAKPANTCGLSFPGSTNLGGLVVQPGVPGVGPGTYALANNMITTTTDGGPPSGSIWFFDKFDNSCTPAGTAAQVLGATSGTVTIVTQSSAAVTGTFDLQFSGGHLTGSFDAPACNVDLNNVLFDGTSCTKNPGYC